MSTKKVARDMPDGSRLVATVELREPGGELSPGFSLTGERFDKRRNASGAARQRAGREPDVCGAIGDEIARAMPELALFNRLHLADLDGVGMHAAANGRYFYEGARVAEGAARERFARYVYNDQYGEAARHGETPAEYGRRVACEILRVDVIPAEFDELDADELPRAFERLVADQRERYAREANEARALFDALPSE